MAMQVTTGPAPTIEQVVIGQLVGFVQLIDKAFELTGKADNGDEYIVLTIADGKNLRELLAGIAGAMTRSKQKETV